VSENLIYSFEEKGTHYNLWNNIYCLLDIYGEFYMITEVPMIGRIPTDKKYIIFWTASINW